MRVETISRPGLNENEVLSTRELVGEVRFDAFPVDVGFMVHENAVRKMA